MTPDVFRAARNQLGLTQTQLGHAFGRSLRQVQTWEQHGPDDLAVRYMAALLSGYRPIDWPSQRRIST